MFIMSKTPSWLNFERRMGTFVDGDGGNGEGGGGSGTGGNSQGTDNNGGAGGDPWYSGYDEESRGWLENRGLTGKSSTEALSELTKGFRNAEKKLGVPADQVLRLPADRTAEGAMDPVYDALGRPQDGEGYQFGDIPQDDQPLQDFANWARGKFHEIGLSGAQGKAMYDAFVERVQKAVTDRNEQIQSDAAASLEDLKKEWGETFAKNEAIAKQVLAKLDVPEDTKAKLTELLGHGDVLKLFQSIGAATSEDKFIDDNGGGGFDGATTPAAAKQKISELKQDQDFVKRYLAGDTQARAEMSKYHKIAYGTANVL